jgi:hypothetical protein
MSWRWPLVCGLLLGSAPALLGQEKAVETPYYPLKAGTKWEYRAGDRKLVSRVARQDEKGTLIEVLIDGKVVDRQHILIKADGIYRTTLNGEAYSSPFRLLNLPPKAGDKWRFDTALKEQKLQGEVRISEAEVTVPAGKYKTFAATADFKVGDRSAGTTWYFAPDVGPVKIVVKGRTEDLVIELEKLEPGK